MNYEFPKIEHISQVEQAIKGVDNISIIDKDIYKVIAYRLNTPDLFPEVQTYEDAIRRECRGLIFDQKGHLLSRPYHKFFNVNERDETALNKIDISQPHYILDKLDGSMITSIKIDKGYRLCTKRGITDISMQAEEFIADKERYNDFIFNCIRHKITPIFEWCSSQNRIILDYPDSLILTAIRDNYTGSYYMYDFMKDIASIYEIPVVPAYSGSISSMEHLVSIVKDQIGIEGYVLRFFNGHMAKCKSDWYVTLHKTKDAIRFEKDIVKLILTESLDDLKPLLLETDFNRVVNFENNFTKGFNDTITYVQESCEELLHLDRKAYAMEIKNKLPGNFQFLAFSLYDNKPIEGILKDYIIKKTSSQSSLIQAKHLYKANYFENNIEDKE